MSEPPPPPQPPLPTATKPPLISDQIAEVGTSNAEPILGASLSETTSGVESTAATAAVESTEAAVSDTPSETTDVTALKEVADTALLEAAAADIVPTEEATENTPSEIPSDDAKQSEMASAATVSEITASIRPASVTAGVSSEDTTGGDTPIPRGVTATQHVERETFYRVKWVMDETGRSICIALQNENGPCAMLALLNIFLQRGTLTLPPGSQSVSESRAMSMLAELALTRGSSDDGRSVQHFVEVLPTLNRGMFVSPKFYAPTAFEDSKEMAAFAAFPDVRLMHGWLVDPQDEALVRAFGDLSYNQVMDELVRLSAANGSMSMHGAPPPFPDTSTQTPVATPAVDPLDLIDVGLPPHLQPSAPPHSPASNDNAAVTSDEATTGLSLKGDEALNVASEVSNAPVENATESRGSITAEEASKHAVDSASHVVDDETITPAAVQETNNGGPSEIEITLPPVHSSVIEAQRDEVESPGIVPAVTSTIARHAAAVWEFLETFSTHLTYHGIAEVNGQLRDGETCILFRNSHFYVLRKRGGDLYTLCTDVGFLKADVAWEILRDINGDSDFYDALFHPAVLSRPVIPPDTRPQPPLLPSQQAAASRPKTNTPPRQPQRVAKRNPAAATTAASSNGSYGAHGRHPRHQPSVPHGRRKPMRAKDESCVLQ